MQSFDVIIPIKSSDWTTAKETVTYIKKNITPKSITIISADSLLDNKDFQQTDVNFVSEDNIFAGLSLANVKIMMEHLGIDSQGAGWYLQQFIKLAYSRICQDKYYLVWDADTIPVRRIEFFDSHSQHPFISLKREYHPRYFKTIKHLLGIEKIIEASFIAEHMLIDCALCQEVLNVIEKNNNLEGKYFWQKVLYAVFLTGEGYAFSEFETLGTYFLTKYPGYYQPRKLETLRTGRLYLGENPETKLLVWAGESFDTVSFEHSDSKPYYRYVAKFVRFFLGKTSLKDAIIKTNKLASKLAKSGVTKFKKINERLCLRQEFDFMFDEKSVFEEMGLSLTPSQSIYIDLTCLINFAKVSSHVTGTERVVISLAKELLLKHGDVHFIFLNEDDRHWYDISHLAIEDFADLNIFQKIRFDRHLFVYHTDIFKSDFKARPLKKRPALLLKFIRNRLFYYTKKKHSLKIKDRIHIKTIDMSTVESGSFLLIFHWFSPTDIYHSFINTWHMRLGKVVFFFHDIIPLTNPEYAHPSWVSPFREYIHLIHETADLLLTSAKFNVNEYFQYITNNSTKNISYTISAIGLPVQFSSHTTMDESHVSTDVLWLKAYKYCLCVGSIHPRKNHFELIQAWKKFYESDAYDNEILVIAGSVWHTARHIGKLLRDQTCCGSIVLLEDVDDMTLRYLYAHCRFTICLSLHEGWGLPVSESISAGKPVLALNSTTLPEAGYGLACLVERKLQDIARGIKKLFNDDAYYEQNLKSIATFQNQLPNWGDFTNRVLKAINNL